MHNTLLYCFWPPFIIIIIIIIIIITYLNKYVSHQIFGQNSFHMQETWSVPQIV